MTSSPPNRTPNQPTAAPVPVPEGDARHRLCRIGLCADRRQHHCGRGSIAGRVSRRQGRLAADAGAWTRDQRCRLYFPGLVADLYHAADRDGLCWAFRERVSSRRLRDPLGADRAGAARSRLFDPHLRRFSRHGRRTSRDAGGGGERWPESGDVRHRRRRPRCFVAADPGPRHRQPRAGDARSRRGGWIHSGRQGRIRPVSYRRRGPCT